MVSEFRKSLVESEYVYGWLDLNRGQFAWSESDQEGGIVLRAAMLTSAWNVFEKFSLCFATPRSFSIICFLRALTVHPDPGL